MNEHASRGNLRGRSNRRAVERLGEKLASVRFEVQSDDLALVVALEA
ncbi:MAG: hypothetical protein JWN06_2388 [Propionibacteriaceae bacterium]|jgi:hypothetical protein|nr:hypothetical protein [Propionibacteriaceae bacterium]